MTLQVRACLPAVTRALPPLSSVAAARPLEALEVLLHYRPLAVEANNKAMPIMLNIHIDPRLHRVPVIEVTPHLLNIGNQVRFIYFCFVFGFFTGFGYFWNWLGPLWLWLDYGRISCQEKSNLKDLFKVEKISRTLLRTQVHLPCEIFFEFF